MAEWGGGELGSSDIRGGEGGAGNERSPKSADDSLPPEFLFIQMPLYEISWHLGVESMAAFCTALGFVGLHQKSFANFLLLLQISYGRHMGWGGGHGCHIGSTCTGGATGGMKGI